MLSGIGPADHLDEMDIEVVVDNPNVGEHLQDHPFYLLNCETTAKGTLAEAEQPKQLLNFFLRGRGLLTSTVAEGTAFFRSNDELAAPDLQLHFGAAYFHNHGFDTHDKPAFAIAPTLVAPQSRGHVRLRTADPLDAPSIVGNHLTERADIDAMIVGVERARDIAAQAALRPFTGKEIHPGESVVGRRGRRGGPAPRHRADLPPDQHGPDRLGGDRRRRRGPARPRGRRAAGRRRLGVPHDPARQHQCRHLHGRREGRRHDQGPVAADTQRPTGGPCQDASNNMQGPTRPGPLVQANLATCYRSAPTTASDGWP